MAATVAGVSNTGENTIENPDAVEELKQEDNVASHGDGSHTHGEVTAEAPETNSTMQKASAITFSSSPAKIAGVGYNNPSFRMKASGPKYNNSPIEKNFGSPAHRGFATFGVGSTEKQGGVGADLEPPLKSSPAKGFFGNLKDRVLNLTKKASKVPTTVSTPTTEAADATAQATNNATAQAGNASVKVPSHSHGADGGVEASNQTPVGKVQVTKQRGIGDAMGEITAQTGVDFSKKKAEATGGVSGTNIVSM